MIRGEFEAQRRRFARPRKEIACALHGERASVVVGMTTLIGVSERGRFAQQLLLEQPGESNEVLVRLFVRKIVAVGTRMPAASGSSSHSEA